MDHQWRQGPVQGRICPVCCHPHFPLCPPPPSLGPIPSFPPPPGHQVPGLGLYHPRPWRGPATGVDPPSQWPEFHNPPLADPYGQFPHRPHSDSFPPAQPHAGGSDGFSGEGERNYKRMRVDARGSCVDERRLKLIRDHGGGSSGYGLEVDRLANDASSPAAELAAGDKELSRFNGPVSGNIMFRENGSLQRTDLPQSSWSENPGMRPPNYEHWSRTSRGSVVSNYSPPQPYRVLFRGNDMNRPFNGIQDPSGYPHFLGTTRYAAPSSKIHSPQPPRMSSSLFPVPVNSSGTPPSYPPAHDTNPLQSNHHHNRQLPDATNGLSHEECAAAREIFSMQYMGDRRPLPSKQLPLQKPKVIDASHIFKLPHRATRPDHFVVILRGLPGSGKSYMAKMLRDLEVENGGAAPRIYSMDEYFMTEVEKVEEVDSSKSIGAMRGKRSAAKKVMEYCYEPEMEEAYRASMLKAYTKTVEEGVFTFIIVDDRNLRVADFAQFWATGKKSGYEMYVLEAPYKDPEGCAARNVHGFTLDDIKKMAGKWEEAPTLYLQLDAKSLFHGDDLKESGIQEVDMDMEDDNDQDPSRIEGKMPEKGKEPPLNDDAPSEDHPKDGESWDVGHNHSEPVRDLGQSKWSEDPEEPENAGAADSKGSLSVLSSLGQAYKRKTRKSVRWGDKVGDNGFSIIAAKKSNSSSLVIGPGTGYNLKSNPLPKEDGGTSAPSPIELKRHKMFQERLKAERESFKAVFDRRRHRIGGLQPNEE